MSFFRRAISPATRETLKFVGGVSLGVSAYTGGILGTAVAIERKLPFPQDAKVIAKSAEFGMFKVAQYAAFPITYSLPKTLVPESNLGYLIRTDFMDLIENAADAEKSKIPEAKEAERLAASSHSHRR